MRTYVVLYAQSDRYGIKTALVDERAYEEDGEDPSQYFVYPDRYESITEEGTVDIEDGTCASMTLDDSYISI